MGELRDRMEGDLLLRGVAEVTRAEYLRCARQFAAHYRRSPAELGAEDVRAYLFHLARTLNYSPANLKMHVAVLKFLYTSPLCCARRRSNSLTTVRGLASNIARMVPFAGPLCPLRAGGTWRAVTQLGCSLLGTRKAFASAEQRNS